MELWDIYDVNHNPTGRTHERGKPLGEGEYHMTVHIAIFSTDGRLLIQQRTGDRASFGGMWDISCAGSVLAGEDSAMGAHRELIEELGLDRDFSGIRPHMTVNYENGFGNYYLLTEDVDISALRLQASEVADAKYASLEEILSLIDKGEFIPYHKSFISFLFDLRRRYSTHNS